MSKPSEDDNLVRKKADDVAAPDAQELSRVRDMADARIDTTEIPDLGDSTSVAPGHYVCLRLDSETFGLLRSTGIVAEELRTAIREYARRRTDDAA